eukprot:TRINITY_DN26079_c0_g1_i1.p1 TRINITY_DN26079_c0_g1~~TRINITY_DN26079_c0_g1_i1.p1  ORF type:complete len:457 (+),score=92.62 TRINITY_DN26079_c0_g1_i1:77-1372(+)
MRRRLRPAAACLLLAAAGGEVVEGAEKSLDIDGTLCFNFTAIAPTCAACFNNRSDPRALHGPLQGAVNVCLMCGKLRSLPQLEHPHLLQAACGNCSELVAQVSTECASCVSSLPSAAALFPCGSAQPHASCGECLTELPASSTSCSACARSGHGASCSACWEGAAAHPDSCGQCTSAHPEIFAARAIVGDEGEHGKGAERRVLSICSLTAAALALCVAAGAFLMAAQMPGFVGRYRELCVCAAAATSCLCHLSISGHPLRRWQWPRYLQWAVTSAADTLVLCGLGGASHLDVFLFLSATTEVGVAAGTIASAVAAPESYYFWGFSALMLLPVLWLLLAVLGPGEDGENPAASESHSLAAWLYTARTLVYPALSLLASANFIDTAQDVAVYALADTVLRFAMAYAMLRKGTMHELPWRSQTHQEQLLSRRAR